MHLKKPPAKLSGKRQVRVFIADDDPLTIEVFTQTFKTFPAFEIAGSSQTPQETLDKVQAMPADLLILDIHLQGSRGGLDTGLELISKLREMQPDIKILVVTGKG